MAVAGLLLVPVPGLALTFLGPWRVLANFHTPGVPGAIISRVEEAGAGGPLRVVVVNMGNASPGQAGL
jgi:hypothetical protein